MATIANCLLRLYHDEDACLWLVAEAGDGDPAALTVEIDNGAGDAPEAFVANPPGFPSRAFSATEPRGAWCLGDGVRSVRIAMPDGQVLDVESVYFRA